MGNQHLYLLIGQWQTPGHSKNRKYDDSHKAKKEILKRIGEKEYQKQVGSNPDIGIENGYIVLKGVGDFKHRKVYVSNIPVEDFFVLRFIPIQEDDSVKVNVIVPTAIADEKEQQLLFELNEFDIVVIPNNQDLIISTVNALEKMYLDMSDKQRMDFVIYLTGQ